MVFIRVLVIGAVLILGVGTDIGFHDPVVVSFALRVVLRQVFEGGVGGIVVVDIQAVQIGGELRVALIDILPVAVLPRRFVGCALETDIDIFRFCRLLGICLFNGDLLHRVVGVEIAEQVVFAG